MSDWPPTPEEFFATKSESAVHQYSHRVRAEIASVPHFRDLSSANQRKLSQFLLHLASVAMAAKSRLNRHWTAAELAFEWPPEGRGDFRTDKTRDYKAWRLERERQMCIDHCWAARQAALRGDLISALDHALSGGEYAHGDFAEIGRRTRAPRSRIQSASQSNETRAALNRATILREAREVLLTRLKSGKKGHTAKFIAAEVADRHRDEKGFPKSESIRRTLGENKSWESQP
jgi:hypothetical protein